MEGHPAPSKCPICQVLYSVIVAFRREFITWEFGFEEIVDLRFGLINPSELNWEGRALLAMEPQSIS